MNDFNNVENLETLLQGLQQEQESFFSDTDNLEQPLMGDYTYNQARKECEAAVGIDVEYIEIDKNGNKTLCLFRNLKYKK